VPFRAEADTAVDITSLDQGLLWNSYMISPLLQFRSQLTEVERKALDHSRMLTSVVRGYAATMMIPPSSTPLRRTVSSRPSTLTVISRLSSRRAGTRFNSRGVDDDGNVANFVETETIFWSPSGVCFSYVQIRGSVPIFWESSSSLLPGQQKIQITRSPEATQPASDKHFAALEHVYGAVHIVNLLSASKPGEAELTERYRYHISNSPLRKGRGENEASEHYLLRETEFDFHERTRGAGGYEGARAIRPYLEASAEAFVYFMSEDTGDSAKATEQHAITKPVAVMQQSGVFRVNCLDCLDRTNLVQGLISQMALELFLSHRGEVASQDFWMRHSSLWADNGDALSTIYAGTGALKSSFTRHGKMSLAGAIADARKSATRLYVNNFADKGRQNTIDLLLGRLLGQTPVELYDPINDFVTAELGRRALEFTSSRNINIRVCTFNLNGKTEGAQEDLLLWLCQKPDSETPDPDIIAVGFQEIVELSPQQIMSTDPAHRSLWENAVKRTLNSNTHAQEDPNESYLLLRSGQLVGAALMIFVKSSFLSSIKNVEGSIKKTGLSGIAGNKGAVAIRMDVESSSLCFVTAHLAAGFANYEERNRDYKTISSGLTFQKNRSIDDHDSIIWLGDFNYRIGLGHEKVKQLMAAGDLETLYENDQLNLQMVAGVAFPFYSESRVTFLPTYKFDVGTDNYDTSEKNRIPAWTDRILRKGNNLRQTAYDSAPLRFSDHKPVYATFECEITIIQEEKKAMLSKQLYEKRKKDLGLRRGAIDGMDDLGSGAESDDDDLMGYESIALGLPPASSDRRKWWLDGDKSARSQVGPPREGMVPNDRRPGNPWRETSEPDWVDVKRPSSTEGIARRLRENQGANRSGSPKPDPPPPRRTMVVPSWTGSRPTGSEGKASDDSARLRTMTPSPALPVRAAGRTGSVSLMTTSSTSKKAPPLKPVKPATLTSSPSQASVPQLDGGNARRASLPADSSSKPPAAISQDSLSRMRSDSKPPLPIRTNTASSTSSFVTAPLTPGTGAMAKKVLPPPVQPRRLGNLQTQDSGASARTIKSEDSSGPPLPPRRAETNKGLMDEELSESMQDWKPLQPR
jgi:endonuclease/exonuclease/phosphatase family metal-dependent hydrolase